MELLEDLSNILRAFLIKQFEGIFNKTIFQLVLVGYEIIIANSALCASLANSIISYPTSTRGIIILLLIIIVSRTTVGHNAHLYLMVRCKRVDTKTCNLRSLHE